MKLLLILSLLSFSALGQEKEKDSDPFKGDSEELGWPSNIAPSKTYLKKLKEQDLSKKNKDQSIHVRFIYVPTFHKPISIHVTKNVKGITLRYVQMSGGGGYDWKKIESEKTISVTEANWNKLVHSYSIKGARKPTDYLKKEYKKDFIEMASGLDGSAWYLEVKDIKGYTVEGVPNPIDDKDKPYTDKEMGLDLRPFVATCELLVKLAGVKLDLKF